MTPAQFQAWIEPKIIAALNDFTAAVRDDIQASIGQPCPQYNTGHGGHSHAGNPPFSETGTLYRGIVTTPARAIGGGTVTATVDSTAPYGAAVESRRPYMAPAAKRAAAEIAGELSAGLAARLP